jgi:hypothetical protein
MLNIESYLATRDVTNDRRYLLLAQSTACAIASHQISRQAKPTEWAKSKIDHAAVWAELGVGEGSQYFLAHAAKMLEFADKELSLRRMIRDWLRTRKRSRELRERINWESEWLRTIEAHRCKNLRSGPDDRVATAHSDHG